MEQDSLEDNVQTLRTPDKAIVLYNVRMIQVLEQINLHFHVLQIGHAQVLQAHLLDRHRLARAPVQRAVDAAKRALAQTVAQLVVLEAGDVLGSALGGAFPAGPLFALALALAGLAVCRRGRGRGRRLLAVAGRVGRGLRGARVRGRVRGFGRVRDHAGGVAGDGGGGRGAVSMSPGGGDVRGPQAQAPAQSMPRAEVLAVLAELAVLAPMQRPDCSAGQGGTTAGCVVAPWPRYGGDVVGIPGPGAAGRQPRRDGRGEGACSRRGTAPQCELRVLARGG